MKIVSFHPDSSLYQFEMAQLQANWHAHPAMEVIMASDNSLQMETEDQSYEGLTFAIIDANVSHSVYSDRPVQLWMIEDSLAGLQERYKNQHLLLKEGIYVRKDQGDWGSLAERLLGSQEVLKLTSLLDSRVQLCLNYFRNKHINYTDMMESLCTQVHLSESRLSHLFKREMGLSLKKHLVWSRLRETIQYVLSEEIGLYEAGLKSGFFDQAHLSKAFHEYGRLVT